jgi:hypothetical protein
MSSELVSANKDTPEQGEPLHSAGFRWLMRLFAVLLAADAGRVVVHQGRHCSTVSSCTNALLHAGSCLLFAYFLWFREKRVFAASSGLIVRTGSFTRIVPWSDVVNWCEVRSMTWHPPWYPKRYVVDLRDDEAIEFVGRRDALKIVSRVRSRGVAP